MIDTQPQADRILVAQLHGEARHHAKWRELTEAEETAAVTELRDLADGRADLLAEVAGILEGASEGELDEPLARQAAMLCRKAGLTRERSRHGSRPAASGGRMLAGRRSQSCATAVLERVRREAGLYATQPDTGAGRQLRSHPSGRQPYGRGGWPGRGNSPAWPSTCASRASAG